MLVVIVNHNHNANAIKLRQQFLQHACVRLLDSGSRLSVDDRAHFDECLGNVYYSGLLNRAAELGATLAADDPILLICSDVEIPSPRELLEFMVAAFANPAIGVWAPSADVQSFMHMRPHGTGGLRRVAFADGFCFSARKSLFDQVCPVDVAVNRLGWGPDVQFGYAAITQGRHCVVDDRVSVIHRDGAGYDANEAERQYRSWRRELPWPARFFHQYARQDRYLEGFPSRLLIVLTGVLFRVWKRSATARTEQARD